MKLQAELSQYKEKENDSFKQVQNLQERYQKMEKQREQDFISLKEKLEKKNKEISKLEKSLFEERKSNKILMSETQSVSRRTISRISSANEINAQEYLQNFLKLEEENRTLKIQNKALNEEMIYQKIEKDYEQNLLYSSIASYLNS